MLPEHFEISIDAAVSEKCKSEKYDIVNYGDGDSTVRQIAN
jgi:hypothetical protein